MDALTNFRLEEAERLIKWTLENPGKWNSVISNDDMCCKEHMAELLKTLLKAELYQIIVVVLALDYEDSERGICGREIPQASRDMIAEMWNKESLLQLVDKVIGKIENACS